MAFPSLESFIARSNALHRVNALCALCIVHCVRLRSTLFCQKVFSIKMLLYFSMRHSPSRLHLARPTLFQFSGIVRVRWVHRQQRASNFLFECHCAIYHLPFFPTANGHMFIANTLVHTLELPTPLLQAPSPSSIAVSLTWTLCSVEHRKFSVLP